MEQIMTVYGLVLRDALGPYLHEEMESLTARLQAQGLNIDDFLTNFPPCGRDICSMWTTNETTTGSRGILNTWAGISGLRGGAG